MEKTEEIIKAVKVLSKQPISEHVVSICDNIIKLTMPNKKMAIKKDSFFIFFKKVDKKNKIINGIKIQNKG